MPSANHRIRVSVGRDPSSWIDYGDRREGLRRTLRSSEADAFLVSITDQRSLPDGIHGRFVRPADRTAIEKSSSRTGVSPPSSTRNARGVEAASGLPATSCSQRDRPRRRGAGMAAPRLRGDDLHRGRVSGALRRDARRVELIGVSGWVEALRRVKDDVEIAAIREAVRCAERAFTMVRAGLRREDSEKDVADAIEAALRRCGARHQASRRSWRSGSRRPAPRPPDADDTNRRRRFRPDRLGGRGEPYKSDLTRVLVTGKVTPKFETIYRTVLAAQERAISAIRPGAKAHDIDAEARSVIEAAGFGGFFDHGLGHGIGMEIHEAPGSARVRRMSSKPGMWSPSSPASTYPTGAASGSRMMCW